MSDYTPEQIEEMKKAALHSNFTTEIHKRNGDSNDIYWFKDKKHVGSGFICKEGERKGHICVLRCPACQRENYGMNVLSGFCTWCPFDANGENE